MMMLSFLAVLFLASTATTTNITPCDGVSPPIALRVDGCNEQPCKFQIGGKFLAEMDFLADRPISNMEPELIAWVFGMEVNFPIEEQDACKSLINAECPLENGDKATYLLDIPILSYYPPLKGKMRFALKHVTKEATEISCFMLDAEIS